MAEQKLKIPLAYRALFLYFEPAAALFGALLLHFRPEIFLNTMSPVAKYATDNQVIYDQLFATYTLFAFNEAVILRITKDLRVWKALLVGILVCDAIHLYGSWAALGGAVFWDIRSWRPEDWANLGSLWGQAAVRVAFLAGVGLKEAIPVKSE
ncbi:hypothetical protein M441DRAFT_46939 [Trichoderma asperellum CBS 433.97]|uniref:DUF7704 domain-containing protein n=1 Tax=Trichoderma asperellum (strain ATCC 204424 / CBS 433.97 / NBRC 101777) TaxID=1042311 RepID=A0A2T3ZAN2_TRIA4|nr:hypothetical protein M441DRAFT_46939 [Trichoderma asperellum CBS 433.97]PTB41830.1 hypothetical protein M441DRAFT_46939 [Trichoderma asperellum CBS 433.97]